MKDTARREAHEALDQLLDRSLNGERIAYSSLEIYSALTMPLRKYEEALQRRVAAKEAIRRRNVTWRRDMDTLGVCQECGAGQSGYPSPADIDTLLAEIERLTLNVMVREEWEG